MREGKKERAKKAVGVWDLTWEWQASHIGHSTHCSLGHGGRWQGDAEDHRQLSWFPGKRRPPVVSQETTIPGIIGTLLRTVL